MRQEPVVITGARSTSNRTPVPSDEGESGKPKLSTGISAIPVGKRVFQSKAMRYRIQLTAPERLKFADGRIVEGERPKVAQFHDYLLILDEVKDQKTIEMIEGHPDFKTDFWDLKTMIDSARQKRVDDAMKLVSSDKEFREAIIEALTAAGGDDFEVPKK